MTFLFSIPSFQRVIAPLLAVGVPNDVNVGVDVVPPDPDATPVGQVCPFSRSARCRGRLVYSNGKISWCIGMSQKQVRTLLTLLALQQTVVAPQTEPAPKGQSNQLNNPHHDQWQA